MIKNIIVDIEGTITSIEFVHEILFPYSKKYIPSYLQEYAQEPKVAMLIPKICELGGQKTSSPENATDVVIKWIAQDMKIPELKTLQGYVWRLGYEQGHFNGHLYADAYKQLTAWKETGISLWVYSSGSIEAQELLFEYSDFGDVRSLFCGFFDTRVGAKKEEQSYGRILELIRGVPSKTVFLSDVESELDAASKQGICTGLLDRQRSGIKSRHIIYHDFNSIDLQHFYSL